MSYTLHTGDSLDVLRTLPEASVHTCVTSPPYYRMRDYGVDGQYGLEPTIEDYIARQVEVFREVRRVLRPDGTLWLNMGDRYANDRKWGGASGGKEVKALHGGGSPSRRKCKTGFKDKELLGLPWRLALALQADGWWLRADCIWCLSGGTWVYARMQSGEGPITIKDLARRDPSTIQLWNGERWTQLLGISKSPRIGDEVEIVLRSGERISCTPTHKFPTGRGLLEASELHVGDVLQRCALPDPENPRTPEHLGLDAAWLAGLYIAEGSRSGETIQISGHSREEARWERLQRIAKAYGGSATRTVSGNTMSIRLYGRVLVAVIDELVSGRVAADKCIAPVVWRYSNEFLAELLEGYLSGDGHWDEKNQRWRLGFTRNYNLERDLRIACARLGFRLILRLAFVPYKGEMRPTFRGELRKTRSGHHSERLSEEVIAIRRARCREVYDLGVADEPHLFSLASGVLTHNSKPNAKPESVKDRPGSAHEYVFLLAKSEKYYYDWWAVREPQSESERTRRLREADRGSDTQYKLKRDGDGRFSPVARPIGENGCFRSSIARQKIALTGMRNLRSVWTIATQGFKEAHFATFPLRLAERCIAAGSSEHGCCSWCGSPWRRYFLTHRMKCSAVKALKEQGIHRIDQFSADYEPPKFTHWGAGCGCELNREAEPCTVLDPYAGAGSTLVAAVRLGRRAIGIELNVEYATIARRRIDAEIAKRAEVAG